MSLHRRAAKRDDNEPEIRKAFAQHGWHTETLSETGLPDLIAWPPDGRILGTLVDVKGLNGTVTTPQREKWKALSERGIPVYVVRTEADVDALVGGELEPWRPEVMGLKATADRLFRAKPGRRVSKAFHTPHVRVTSGGYDPANPPRGDVDLRTRPPGKEWRPPRSTGVDAAKPMGMGHALVDQDPAWLKARIKRAEDAVKEAAETFAPPTGNICAQRDCTERSIQGYPWCAEHTP